MGLKADSLNDPGDLPHLKNSSNIRDREDQEEVKMPRKIFIFDTTLRDGEQVPGASLNAAEKMEIARQLAKLKVDVI